MQQSLYNYHMKIKQPKLPSYLEAKMTYANDELSYSTFNEIMFSELIDKHLVINECTFTQCHFLCKIQQADCMDIIFDNCDLSNCTFTDSIFHRIIFKNCKMMGCDFSGSTMQNVQFIDCIANYSNFSFCNCNTLLYKSNNLEQASFNETKLKDVHFVECRLLEAEFIHCPLNNVDLSNSDINGISITLDDLQGLIVNSEQAIELSKLLGLIVKDPWDND